MKKNIIICLMLTLMMVVSCKSENKKVELKDIYGKYYYEECLYYAYSSSSKEIETKNNKDNVRYSLMETSYYYFVNGTEPLMTFKNIEYVEKDVFEDFIQITEIRSILKKSTTRYDIYMNGKFQCYSFIFEKNKVYFMETYNDSGLYKVKQIVLIKKHN